MCGRKLLLDENFARRFESVYWPRVAMELPNWTRNCVPLSIGEMSVRAATEPGAALARESLTSQSGSAGH